MKTLDTSLLILALETLREQVQDGEIGITTLGTKTKLQRINAQIQTLKRS
tara:strand:+ start:303 stop:452 length:150 start_codon:yes stop_codon:yes gene_type:complete